MKTGKVAGVLACLCLGLLTACQQTKEGNPISSLPGPIIPVQNPNTEPGGTGVGLPSTPPIGSVPPGQPSPLVPPPVSAPTIPPLPTPNPSPSIVGLPPGPLAAPTFTKSFSPSTTSVGVPVTLSFTITNNSGIQLTGLSFTDSLAAGLVVDTPLNFTNTCGGSVAAAPGGASIALSGGILAANATCAVTVQVVASAPGTYTNPPVTLTSAQAPAVQSAPVNLSVNPVTAPTFTKSFNPASAVGAPVTVTVIFTIVNNSGIQLTGLNFADSLPAGLVVDTPLNFTNTCGGSVAAAPGGASIALNGGTLAANATCAVTVQVVAASVGTYTNPAVTLTSNQAPAVQSAPTDLSVISVPAPGFNKQFVPNSTTNGSVVTVVFTITNNAPVPLSGLSFIDPLPLGLRITTPSVATLNTCGGTLTAPAGGNTISLAGGSLAAGASCVVSVSVEQAPPLPAPPVTYTNPPVPLFSSGAPPATSAPATVTFTP
jgi:uncharacterized repeat protein (TIGR01451 family)